LLLLFSAVGDVGSLTVMQLTASKHWKKLKAMGSTGPTYWSSQKLQEDS